MAFHHCVFLGLLRVPGHCEPGSLLLSSAPERLELAHGDEQSKQLRVPLDETNCDCLFLSGI